MKNKENLKQQIINANKVYRDGHPIMTDITFDKLLEQYEKLCNKDEFTIFRESLHESAGKIKHPYIMGSLDKIKTSEPDNIEKFLKKYIKNSLFVTAKVDGISCRIRYENGKLVAAASRGDGQYGETFIDKINYIKNVPLTINYKNTIDIRGELVILKNDFAKLNGFANARNACAGIMNKKYWEVEEVSVVSFIAYTILGYDFSKEQQLKILEDNNFNVVYHTSYDIDTPLDELIENLMIDATRDYQYETDGLVICDSNYFNEDKYRPDACKAVKINQLTAITKIINIVWDGPSPNGNFVPVAILEPIDLSGAIISRVMCHNVDYLKEKNIDIGDTVEIVKAGDIVPQIIKVIQKNYITHIKQPKKDTDILNDILSNKILDENIKYYYSRWNVPIECPFCETKIIKNGINFKCINEKCPEQVVQHITSFIKKLGVKHSSSTTLKNFGITSFEDLINFKPDEKYKSQVKLYDELTTKVFTRSKQDLLAATNFDGLAEIQINKIVDFYGFNNILECTYVGYPDGIGELTLNKFKQTVLDNLKLIDMFLLNSRYNYLDISLDSSKFKETNGRTICFTGKLYTMSRNEASKLAEDAGFEIKNSVVKGLTYLITNNINSNSSKAKKALQLKITVLSEKDFLKLVNNDTNDLLLNLK